MTEPNHEVEQMSEPIVFEVISGVEGACLAAGQGEADTRIAGRKPWGGGTVIHTFRVPVDGFLRDVPAIQAAAKAQTLAEVREALLAEHIIEQIGKEECIDSLYGHWEDFPAREANQQRRYEQLSEDVKESYRRPVREAIEKAFALSTLEETQGEGG